MAIRDMLPDIWRGQAWSPLREMSRLQRRIDRLFDEMVEPGELFPVSFARLEFVPPCDVRETDSGYLISFDLPGVSKDDVKIEMRDHQLIVSGERKKEEREEGRYARERAYGAFQRVLNLPLAAGAEKIQANYENGVLRIVVPKSEAAKPRLIPIHEKKAA